MFLIFDTETTGFPIDKNAPITQLDNWPRIVQIAWQLHDVSGNLIENFDYIIKPQGFSIPFNAQKIHGISTEKAINEGIELNYALEKFNISLQKANFIVGHNIVDFDVKILASEYFRQNIETNLQQAKVIDTIEKGTQFCALPGGRGGGFKYPKLNELYHKLFNENFDEAHNAAADVNANARAFFEMIRLKIFNAYEIGFSIEEQDSFLKKYNSTVPKFKINIRKQTEKLDNNFSANNEDNQSQNIIENTSINNSNFFHYHVHTTFSILNSTIKVSELVKKIAAQKMPAIAITDFGNLMGAFQFLDEVAKVNKTLPQNQQIIPIIGCEVYISDNYLQNKFTKDNPDRRYNQVLLAKNYEGYKNLSKISTIGYTKGLYAGFPRVSKEVIIEYKDNLIATTGNIWSEIPSTILNYGEEKAEEAFVWWKNTFKDDFYVELQNHGLEEEEHVNEVLQNFAKKYNVKVLVQNEPFYLEKDEADSQDILICIKDGEKKSVPVGRGFGYRFGLKSNEYYLKTSHQLQQLFTNIDELEENFKELLSKFQPYSLHKKVLLPKFKIPKEFEIEEDKIDNGTRGENNYLKHLTYQGAKKRYGEDLSKQVIERIEFELEIIAKTGYPGYFLIVQDFTNEARKMNVSVGPGRGSAAGSLVAYCIGITNVDPIKYDLLFERFLNPDRVSLPDIDIDFDDRGRDKIIQWVVEKYGHKQVAQIITYGTLAGRSAIRDAGRVLELPLNETDRLAKQLPGNLNLTKIQRKSEKEITKEIRNDELNDVLQIKKLLNDNSLTGKVVQNATLIEGAIRNTGVHACGVIITPEDITNLIPVAVSKEADLLVSQFDNSVVENAGLLKMDFLGLRNLTIIKDAIQIIKETKGVIINEDEIPLDDDHTYNTIFKTGNTVGIFQYESLGMQKNLKALQPDKFEDLIAMNALYRPGPMQYIPNFIARKHGKEEISYDLPEMEEYLKDTYGITVYQEQVMLLSQKLANFTRGEADHLRKGMGKKIKEILTKLHPKFIEGGLKNNHPENVLQKIWKDWEAFAEYAFNKSHSTCYAVIAFQTAYLKAHFPAEYMAALLTNNLHQLKTVTFFMDECKRMGIKVLPPDVNESKYGFYVNTEGNIRFGLGAVKGIGQIAVENIVEEREKNGKYKGIFDFFERVELKNVNKKVAESLAYSGAFDELDNYHRGQYFYNESGNTTIENLLRYGTNYQENKANAQNSLFGEITTGFETMKPTMPEAPEWNNLQKLAKEKEMVGVYISAHPLDEYKYEIQKINPVEINLLEDNKDKFINKEVNIIGIITKAEHKISADGRTQFAIFDLEDYGGTTNLKVYGDQYLKIRHYISQNFFVCVKVSIRKAQNGNVYINVNNIILLKDILENISQLHIALNINSLQNNEFEELTKLVSKNKGEKLLFIDFVDAEEEYSVKMKTTKNKISITKSMLEQLESFNGLSFRLN